MQEESYAGQPAKDTILQLIDEEKHFDFDGFSSHLNVSWNMSSVGTAYRIISVLGSQSSGKSTLLNCLFGTEFGVMHENSRSQTTKGIWLSNTPHSSNSLVMDVEGTDGRERGENQDFERKSALFSLALSEILIVNLWEHSIGLYNGANMALLKTVFEVNLELFGRKEESKTLLMFIIRDFLNVTSLDSLAATLAKDIHAIWSKLNKPSGLEDSRLEDFFDLEFAALPHKILKPAEFDEGIDRLKDAFFNAKSKDHLFHRESYQKSVPIDGLPAYAKGIWDLIVTNKDLDLPTQQQLLSQFRCDEIAKNELMLFKQNLLPFQRYSDGLEFNEGALKEMLVLKKSFIKEYEEKSHRYHPEIIQQKQQELSLQIDDMISKILYGFGRYFMKMSISRFESEFFALKNDKKESFKNAIVKAEGAVKANLDQSFSLITCNEIHNLSYQFLWNEFDILLQQEKKTFIDEHARKVFEINRNNCIDSVKKIISTCIENIFEPNDDDSEVDGKQNPWKVLFELISDKINQGKNSLSVSLMSNLCSSASCGTMCSDFVADRWKDSVHEVSIFFETSNLVHELVGIFEKEFKYDKKTQMPRFWSPSDNLDQIYSEILANVEKTIQNFKPYDVEAVSCFIDRAVIDEVHNLNSIMTESKLQNVRNRFKKECEVMFLDTKRSLLMTKTKIPVWVLILLVYLGWREILTVIRNPFYLIFVIFLASSVFVIYSLNLQKPVEYFLSQTMHTGLKTLMSFLNPENQKVTKNGNHNNAPQ